MTNEYKKLVDEYTHNTGDYPVDKSLELMEPNLPKKLYTD